MPSVLRTTQSKIGGLFAALILLVIAVYFSITLGVVRTGWQTLVDAFTAYNHSNEHIVIRNVRVPRALIGAAVGASLGMAGALLQALTRNPLADVGILGINSGASLFVVVAVTFLSASSLSQYVWFAFAGAALTGITVYVLGAAGKVGLSPVKITLAGAAISALCSSLIHTVLVINERTIQEVIFWLSGSVEGRKLDLLLQVLPFMAAGWIVALLVAGPLHTLLLGEDVASGLGQRTIWVKALTGAAVVLLAGGAVAAAGPILFVGLVVPHIVRYLVGADTRWVVAYSGFGGAILLIAADIGARYIAMPQEVPIGVMTAIVGLPFFIYAVRRGNLKG